MQVVISILQRENCKNLEDQTPEHKIHEKDTIFSDKKDLSSVSLAT